MVSALVLTAVAMPHPASAQGTPPAFQDIWGCETNGLQPCLVLDRTPTNWYIAIEFFTLTNFPNYTWLKVTNRVGSRLQLSLTNGVPVGSPSKDLVQAARLPLQTTVPEIMKAVERSRRGLQWMRMTPRALANERRTAAQTTFDLASAFGMPFTNDVLLRITPLSYRVTNGTNARLIEFPPIKLKLEASGSVEHIQ